MSYAKLIKDAMAAASGNATPKVQAAYNAYLQTVYNGSNVDLVWAGVCLLLALVCAFLAFVHWRHISFNAYECEGKCVAAIVGAASLAVVLVLLTVSCIGLLNAHTYALTNLLGNIAPRVVTGN